MLKKLIILVFTISCINFTFADNCSYNVIATDQMTYNTKEINIPSSCKNFTIKLTHQGKMPKAAMGHNIIIAKDTDVQNIIKDGLKVGLAKDYIKANDNKIIVHSKLIGPGETTSISFPVDKIKNGKYTAFCSFPAHETKMHIKLTVK